MKEYPIPFSTPMIPPILEGRKTQTRRLHGLQVVNKNPFDWKPVCPTRENPEVWLFMHRGLSDFVKCPYGKAGDVLWVRESFGIHRFSEQSPEGDNEYFASYEYKADYSDKVEVNFQKGFKWKPSIHMPRAAARIFLKVENIRVERVQDITTEDAIAEGAECFVWRQSDVSFGHDPLARHRHIQDNAVRWFETLWNEINGKRATWESNPWVWVIEFSIFAPS